MKVAVSIERADKKAFATAVDWPGWSRSGKTEELAIEALIAYAQRYAPIATAAGKLGWSIGVARKPLPEKVATNPWLAKAATSPPATVQSVPHTTAARKFETPLPTSVAIPFDTSFAPFAEASTSASRTNTSSPMVIV